jgi:hypothetical protein
LHNEAASAQSGQWYAGLIPKIFGTGEPPRSERCVSTQEKAAATAATLKKRDHTLPGMTRDRKQPSRGSAGKGNKAANSNGCFGKQKGMANDSSAAIGWID